MAPVKEQNWETWNVGLWLNNDEITWRYGKQLAKTTTDSDELKQYVEQLIDLDNLHGIAKDLIINALHKVDWNSLMEDFRE